MKKLLVLILLLGLSVMANAAIIQLRIDTDATDGAGNDTEKNASSATISVVSDTDDYGYDYYLGISTPGEDAGNYGTVTKLAAAGSEASIGLSIDGPMEGYIHATDISAKDVTDPFDVAAGNQFQTILTLTGAAVQIDLLDESMSVIDSITLLPEPMTIALLGLGGLFLRRRK